MANERMRELTKLTDKETGKPIYLDLTNVVAVSFETPHMDYNASPAVQDGTATTLTITSGAQFIVEEHGSEIVARLEGRDPSPSKILFGKKNKNE